MTQEIATQNPYNEDELALVQQMGLEKVPPANVKMFLHTAKSMHLDPRLKRDIVLITRNSKNGPTHTIQVGIAGYRKAGRKIAKAGGETIKVDPWLFCGADEEWKEVWDVQGGKNYPLAAKATIYRDGMPFTQVAMWSEFVQMYNGKPQALWGSKPTYMLGKTAESLAWRLAFPDEMGDTYEESEVAAIHMDATRYQYQERGADAVRAALAQKQQPEQSTAPQPEPKALEAINAAESVDQLGDIMNGLQGVDPAVWAEYTKAADQRAAILNGAQ